MPRTLDCLVMKGCSQAGQACIDFWMEACYVGLQQPDVMHEIGRSPKAPYKDRHVGCASRCTRQIKRLSAYRGISQLKIHIHS